MAVQSLAAEDEPSGECLKSWAALGRSASNVLAPCMVLSGRLRHTDAATETAGSLAMPNRVSQLVAWCCVGATLCLLGLPEFPAFTRAASTLFVPQQTVSPATQEPPAASAAA